MYYTHSSEKSAEYLRLALNQMGRYNIPVDPINYTIWYEYVSGNNSALRAAIDEYAIKSPEFTPEITCELYTKFILDKDSNLNGFIKLEVQRIIETLVENIAKTGEDIAKYSDILETCKSILSNNPDQAAIDTVINDLIMESNSLRMSGTLMKNKLEATNKEVELLKKDLKKLKEQASTDALTGIANRRVFEEELDRQAEYSSTSNTELCLIMTDLDHFKRINDNYGHLIGDRVLKISAGMLKKCIKGKDLVARYGGEEFVIMLPDTPIEGAIILAEKIRYYFSEKKWKKTRTEESIGSITLSLGVASYRHGEDIKDLVRRADNAMYLSKKKGRNLVSSELEITDDLSCGLKNA